MRNQLLVAWLCVAVLAGCKSATPTEPTPPPPPVVTPPPPAAPTLSCPAAVSTSTTGTSATASYEVPTASDGQAPVSVTCSPASGSPFPVGSSEVSCTATDALNRTASCIFAVAVAKTPVATATRFLAFGDSVTLGWTSADNPFSPPPYILTTLTREAYPTVLQELLAARYSSQSITVVNEGKGGERAQDALSRASGAFGTHRPEVVLILTGYNDLGTGGGGIEDGIRGVNDLVKEARFRGARVLLGTLTRPSIGVNRGLDNTTVSRFNDRLREVARGERVTLVDIYAASGNDPNRYNSADGRHPNAAGYRLIAETFAAAIRAEFER